MKRVSKNLTKAVTLSVLLMLPYGITEAREYKKPIGGTYDNYAMILKPGGGPREPIATSEGQRTTYDFGEDETTLNITIDQFKINHGIKISSGSGAIKDREIFIANKLNIILTQDENKPSDGGDGISFSTNSINNLINRKYGGDLTINDGKTGVTPEMYFMVVMVILLLPAIIIMDIHTELISEKMLKTLLYIGVKVL